MCKYTLNIFENRLIYFKGIDTPRRNNQVAQQHILHFSTSQRNNYCFYQLQLQLHGHIDHYVVVKDIKMPS
jgi:hypothetical protein